MKFAKLFDVADTQVLFVLVTDDEGFPSLLISTELDNEAYEELYAFDNSAEGWLDAQAALDEADQTEADDFHADLLGKSLTRH